MDLELYVLGKIVKFYQTYTTVSVHSPHQETRLISDANERVARLRFLLNLRRLYARPFFAMVHKKP
ncbi:MAG: hypothetical protein PHZ24_07350, partial [Bacteroidales bacterium]|nr:hypothetical protein [Bacteroidales bacterium]